ncbi:hypothetical protein KDU71_17720 [Carboxylicivirga sediminis]|uniref:Uncharacterized protein n=1 Tax=Carboxylicivirga sediminis TaxID=2006564 RepID=A0A941F5X1_9BACT|nr:hypothetical protein [Carboxylicivirga sediminis]MBR8537411.1 hypothetical protein [Carboxylicivirga sediminis]
MNLTGQWHFFEQFEAGFDMGYAILKQNGEQITGTLVYREYIYEEGSFLIAIRVEGEVIEDRLMLRGQSYEIIEAPFAIEYCLDDRIAELTNPHKIEGHSVDDQNLEGRFILRRVNAYQA